MVTIRDVARLAGVSTATVSQALNGRGRVDVRTRERVAQAASKLRYVPNVNGRRLARRRAECVAVLQGRNMTTAFNDSFYRVVVGGMAEVTQARGYSLVFTPPADAAADVDLNRILGHGTVDGALVLGAVDAGLLLAFRHRGLARRARGQLPARRGPAGGDPRLSGRRPARHRASSSPRPSSRRVPRRGRELPFGWQTLEGYGEALAAGAIVQDPALIRRTEIGVEPATAAMRSLLALPEPPTALFAVTDAMAIGALRAARERGVGVPDGLAVVGMDDIEMSAYTDPPLTTVRVAKEAMGRLAADWLISLIEGAATGGPAPSMPAELVVRGTCGGLAGTRALAATFPAEARSTISTTEGA